MNGFSDYIVYADESGDHGLVSINPEMPVFVLAFCVFRKEDYLRRVVPAIQELKFRYWGHDGIVLHNHEIRKRRGEFNILLNPIRQAAFLNDLNRCMSEMPVTIIAAVVDKMKLAEFIPAGLNPYDIALSSCLTELAKFLDETSQGSSTTFIVAERRGAQEDSLLELEFRNFTREMPNMRLKFMDKKHNSTGLQVADLVAHPIARHAIDPGQANRAYSILRGRLRAVANIKWKAP